MCNSLQITGIKSCQEYYLFCKNACALMRTRTRKFTPDVRAVPVTMILSNLKKMLLKTLDNYAVIYLLNNAFQNIWIKSFKIKTIHQCKTYVPACNWLRLLGWILNNSWSFPFIEAKKKLTKFSLYCRVVKCQTGSGCIANVTIAYNCINPAI